VGVEEGLRGLLARIVNSMLRVFSIKRRRNIAYMGHCVYAHSSIAQPLSNSKLHIRETKPEKTLSTRMILFGK